MKYLILGDIHGVEYWKDVIELENPDKVIFVGDYLDSFTIGVEKQVKNFKNILEYKRNNRESVILLQGNHDHHYSKYSGSYERYSGYNSSTQLVVSDILTEALINKEIQIAYLLDDKYLITHAGVSKTWFESLTDRFGEDYDRIDDFINESFLFSPYLFDFNGFDPYGDNKTQGPLWIRPNSLYNDMIEDYVQIVGHTKMQNISIDPEEKLYLIDTFSERKYEAYYITIKDGKINEEIHNILQ